MVFKKIRKFVKLSKFKKVKVAVLLLCIVTLIPTIIEVVTEVGFKTFLKNKVFYTLVILSEFLLLIIPTLGAMIIVNLILLYSKRRGLRKWIGRVYTAVAVFLWVLIITIFFVVTLGADGLPHVEGVLQEYLDLIQLTLSALCLSIFDAALKEAIEEFELEEGKEKVKNDIALKQSLKMLGQVNHSGKKVQSLNQDLQRIFVEKGNQYKDADITILAEELRSVLNNFEKDPKKFRKNSRFN